MYTVNGRDIHEKIFICEFGHALYLWKATKNTRLMVKTRIDFNKLEKSYSTLKFSDFQKNVIFSDGHIKN